MITTKIFVDARSANASVKIRIGKDRKAAYIPLPSVVIKPYQWDGKSVVSHPSAALYNAIIAEAKAKIDKAIFLLGDSLEFKDVYEIKDILVEYLVPEEEIQEKRLILPAIIAKAEKSRRPNTKNMYMSLKIDPLITDATFFSGDEIHDGMTPVQRYDAFNGAANIGVRLLMLYADRICDEDTYGKLFKTLRQMPTRGIFSDTDIARFTNNGKR